MSSPRRRKTRRKSLLDEMEEMARSEELQLLRDELEQEEQAYSESAQRDHFEEEEALSWLQHNHHDEHTPGGEGSTDNQVTPLPVVREASEHYDEISHPVLQEEQPANPRLPARSATLASSQQMVLEGSSTSFSMRSAPTKLNGNNAEAGVTNVKDKPVDDSMTHQNSARSMGDISTVGPGPTEHVYSERTPLGFRRTYSETFNRMASLPSKSPKRMTFRPNNLRRPLSSSSRDSVRKSSSNMSSSSSVDLQSGEGSSTWTDTATAAAIVAASAQSIRSYVQFNQGEHVLVSLSLLNITNGEDDKSTFTICPVNKYGYPPGDGKLDVQKRGPYEYLLCVVQNVHFDEDERYYTIKRCDNGSEQRADPGWMEAIDQYDDCILVALRAAQRTKDSHYPTDGFSVSGHGCGQFIGDICSIFSQPVRYFKERVVPFYREKRQSSKNYVTKVLHGDAVFMKIQLTPINLLVVCSILFLLLPPFSLAVLPPKTDKAVAIVCLVVWLVLAIELFFEIAIRPSHFQELIKSDKAYAPSTVRYLNSFHLFFEVLALVLFIPEFPCIFDNNCNDSIPMSLIWCCVYSILGEHERRMFTARFILGLSFLRAFPLVRHWRQMWLMHAFDPSSDENLFLRRLLLADKSNKLKESSSTFLPKDISDESTPNLTEEELMDGNKTDEQRLKNAATIGTALMLLNSHRGLLFSIAVIAFFPAVFNALNMNRVLFSDVELLLENNKVSVSESHCDFLRTTVCSWLQANARSLNEFFEREENLHLAYAALLPARCEWQDESGVITDCRICQNDEDGFPEACALWDNWRQQPSPTFLAEETGTRKGGYVEISRSYTGFANFSDTNTADYYVEAIYNVNPVVSYASASLLMLLLSSLLLVLVGLYVMREDAGRLVLDPLRRMLKIVVRYADNPLSQTPGGKDKSDGRESLGEGKDELGNYETAQLINAISKIADLLRKCWGVAGAGIISSNLARTKDGKTVVFNPTLPGKRVYALFGFVQINHFDRHLRALESEVMILINDVARVVHDEVYRWALNDSGQCNKNLGGMFLMVFRIGDFSEVYDRMRRATDVVFDTQIKRRTKLRRRRISSMDKSRGRSAKSKGSSSHLEPENDGTLQLASLPGIQSFADRAVIGFLKSFAGIHRDDRLRDWKKDFRLGAGVGAFKIDVLYGMDAGWAVEGAVGSEYKIDATYLSPHVNMVSGYD